MSNHQTLITEESLAVLLKMVSTEIEEKRCNASRRTLFLQLLRKVDFTKISLSEATLLDLIAGLRFVANQPDANESRDALNLFAEIIGCRPYDASRIMAILSPGIGNEEGNVIDLATLDCSKETDFFTLKFLLCNAVTEAGNKPIYTSAIPADDQKPKAKPSQKQKEGT